MSYTPTPGFFDISNRPHGLDKRTHLKMQEIQMYLVDMQKKADYYRRFHPTQWEKAKELSGELQRMIFQYYPHDQL